MVSLGLEASPKELYLFSNIERIVFILFYVNDYLVFFYYNNKILGEKIIKGITVKYEVKD